MHTNAPIYTCMHACTYKLTPPPPYTHNTCTLHSRIHVCNVHVQYLYSHNTCTKFVSCVLLCMNVIEMWSHTYYYYLLCTQYLLWLVVFFSLSLFLLFLCICGACDVHELNSTNAYTRLVYSVDTYNNHDKVQTSVSQKATPPHIPYPGFLSFSR